MLSLSFPSLAVWLFTCGALSLWSNSRRYSAELPQHSASATLDTPPHSDPYPSRRRIFAKGYAKIRRAGGELLRKGIYAIRMASRGPHRKSTSTTHSRKGRSAIKKPPHTYSLTFPSSGRRTCVELGMCANEARADRRSAGRDVGTIQVILITQSCGVSAQAILWQL